MIESILPVPLKKSAVAEHETTVHPASMPIILNPAAALQALADFFDGQALLSKDEFIRLLRKSQGVLRSGFRLSAFGFRFSVFGFRFSPSGLVTTFSIDRCRLVFHQIALVVPAPEVPFVSPPLRDLHSCLPGDDCLLWRHLCAWRDQHRHPICQRHCQHRAPQCGFRRRVHHDHYARGEQPGAHTEFLRGSDCALPRRTRG